MNALKNVSQSAEFSSPRTIDDESGKQVSNSLTGAKKQPGHSPLFVASSMSGLLTPEAAREIANGSIPNLRSACIDLFRTFSAPDASHSALNSIPVLKQLDAIAQSDLENFVHNHKTSHVLVDNDLMKVVLIHWPPGKISSIHGHPKGGCVFRVLQGSVEELRYTTDASPQLLAASTYHVGSMAYIDDNIGYHAVGNPFNDSAISLHVYTR